jgi:hypothetical protein
MEGSDDVRFADSLLFLWASSASFSEERVRRPERLRAFIGDSFWRRRERAAAFYILEIIKLT